jgi:hypothetical protein
METINKLTLTLLCGCHERVLSYHYWLLQDWGMCGDRLSGQIRTYMKELISHLVSPKPHILAGSRVCCPRGPILTNP